MESATTRNAQSRAGRCCACRGGAEEGRRARLRSNGTARPLSSNLPWFTSRATDPGSIRICGCQETTREESRSGFRFSGEVGAPWGGGSWREKRRKWAPLPRLARVAELLPVPGDGVCAVRRLVDGRRRLLQDRWVEPRRLRSGQARRPSVSCRLQRGRWRKYVGGVRLRRLRRTARTNAPPRAPPRGPPRCPSHSPAASPSSSAPSAPPALPAPPAAAARGPRAAFAAGRFAGSRKSSGCSPWSSRSFLHASRSSRLRAASSSSPCSERNAQSSLPRRFRCASRNTSSLANSSRLVGLLAQPATWVCASPPQSLRQ